MIYTNSEIVDALNSRYDELINWLQNQDDDLFEKGPEGKWTTGEHAKHLILSTQPLNQGLRMPKLLLRTTFGKNNREEQTYEALVAKYHQKLSEGGRASSRYEPKPISKSEKGKIIQQLQVENQKLVKIIEKWKPKDMTVYLLPHPLLGKLTIREMLFFTVYHTEHHLKALKNHY